MRRHCPTLTLLHTFVLSLSYTLIRDYPPFPQGGAGFIGSHATLRLLRDGHSVTIVVRMPFFSLFLITLTASGFIPQQLITVQQLSQSLATRQDNLSRGNRGAIDALMKQAHSGQLRFIEIDLANRYAVSRDRLLLAVYRRISYLCNNHLLISVEHTHQRTC